MTLSELTNGNESGIIIRDSKYAMIYYGAELSCAADDCLPYIAPEPINDIIWYHVDGAFDNATVEEVEDFRALFSASDYDDCDKWDHEGRFDETFSEGRGRAIVATLQDGTVIIAPRDWN